ncbi:hypothetical protein C8J56DRAFT_972262 [Mycena floridula]|nr:hypothetical protein C8J56DRAFT_972262 [Mycena floridula]
MSGSSKAKKSSVPNNENENPGSRSKKSSLKKRANSPHNSSDPEAPATTLKPQRKKSKTSNKGSLVSKTNQVVPASDEDEFIPEVPSAVSRGKRRAVGPVESEDESEEEQPQVDIQLETVALIKMWGTIAKNLGNLHRTRLEQEQATLQKKMDALKLEKEIVDARKAVLDMEADKDKTLLERFKALDSNPDSLARKQRILELQNQTLAAQIELKRLGEA